MPRKKERPPAFQFYPKDFLSDPNVVRMTYSEIGMYWVLCSYCWLEDCTIPADIGKLSRMLRVTIDTMEEAWKSMSMCFQICDNDCTKLVHPRLKKEKQKMDLWRRKCSLGGTNSAHKRKNRKNISAEQGSVPLVVQNGELKGNSSSSIASATTNNKNTKSHSTPSELAAVKKFIPEEYKRIRGEELITNSSDWIMLSDLAKKMNSGFTFEKISSSWTSFLLSDDQFHQKQGHPLKFWCSNINAFIGRRPGKGLFDRVGESAIQEPADPEAIAAAIAKRKDRIL